MYTVTQCVTVTVFTSQKLFCFPPSLRWSPSNQYTFPVLNRTLHCLSLRASQACLAVGCLRSKGASALLPPHTAARCCTQRQSRSRLAQVEVQLGLERLPDELGRVVVLKLMKLHGKQGSGA